MHSTLESTNRDLERHCHDKFFEWGGIWAESYRCRRAGWGELMEGKESKDKKDHENIQRSWECRVSQGNSEAQFKHRGCVRWRCWEQTGFKDIDPWDWMMWTLIRESILDRSRITQGQYDLHLKTYSIYQLWNSEKLTSLCCLFLLKNNLCMSVLPACIHMHHVYAWHLPRQKEGIGSPVTGVKDHYCLLCWCQDPDSGPMQEKNKCS